MGLEGRCINYFPGAMIKHTDQKQLLEEGMNLGLQFQKVRVRHDRVCNRNRKLAHHMLAHTQEAENEQSGSCPQGPLPMTHFLQQGCTSSVFHNLPQTASPARYPTKAITQGYLVSWLTLDFIPMTCVRLLGLFLLGHLLCLDHWHPEMPSDGEWYPLPLYLSVFKNSGDTVSQMTK